MRSPQTNPVDHCSEQTCLNPLKHSHYSHTLLHTFVYGSSGLSLSPLRGGPLPLGRVEEGFVLPVPVLVVGIPGVFVGPEQPVPGVAQSRQDDAVVVDVGVDGPDRHGDVRVGLQQLPESGARGDDGNDVDLRDSPLTNRKSRWESVSKARSIE